MDCSAAEEKKKKKGNKATSQSTRGGRGEENLLQKNFLFLREKGGHACLKGAVLSSSRRQEKGEVRARKVKGRARGRDQSFI